MTRISAPRLSNADPRDVVSVARADAPRSVGLVDGLKGLGITHFGHEKIDFPALEFGSRLREMRLRRGWTQAQLATVVGCQQGDLSDIERGKGKDGPTYRVLRDLAVALGEPFPINPPQPVALVESGDESQITQSFADFSTFEPLLTAAKRSGLVRYVSHRAKNASSLLQSCTLINVGENSKARLTPNIELVVLTKVSGGGRFQVYNPVHRRHGSDDGDPIAILGPESRVQVTTGQDENLILMVAAAGGVLAASRQEQETAEWIGS